MHTASLPWTYYSLITSYVIAMAPSTNPKFVVLQITTCVVLFSILGTLIAVVWNQESEIRHLKAHIRNVETQVDQTSVPTIIASLKRSTGEGPHTATEILADALTELIEKKLYTIMECNRYENTSTDCSIKPGPKGEKGSTGEQGKEGPQGLQGVSGEKGERGQHGYPGYKGDTGPQGPIGRRGPKGDTGAGLKGDMGPIGPQGNVGDSGPRGWPGAKGAIGQIGSKGIKGSVGPSGPAGSKGERGLKGAKGQHGYPGYKGEKGAAGPQGPPGPRGPPGVNGTNNEPEIIQQITPGHSISNPATSCSVIYNTNPQSGNYWVKNVHNQPVNVFCDMERVCSCNSQARGWMKVADFDMTNSSQQCPNGFQIITRSTAPRRTCGRPGNGCVNTAFPVNKIQYSRVCGRIVAYQYGSPSGFYEHGAYGPNQPAGIILSHGQSPRQHIWSFVNGGAEAVGSNSGISELCPCSGGSSRPGSFIGEDYFCDSAVDINAVDGQFYPNDPLWDGQGCGSSSTCCQFNNPPWFCKQLPQPTTDDIELRLCENSSPSYDDSPFEIVELYVF